MFVCFVSPLSGKSLKLIALDLAAVSLATSLPCDWLTLGASAAMDDSDRLSEGG